MRLHRRSWLRVAAVMLAVSLFALLAACSSSGSDGDGDETPAAAASPDSGDVDDDDGDGGGGEQATETPAAAAEPQVPLGEPFTADSGVVLTVHDVRDGLTTPLSEATYAVAEIEIDASAVERQLQIGIEAFLLQTASGGILTPLGSRVEHLDLDLPAPVAGLDTAGIVLLNQPQRLWFPFRSSPGDPITAVMLKGDTYTPIAGEFATEEELIAGGAVGGPVEDEAEGLRLYITETEDVENVEGRTINDIEVEAIRAAFVVAVGTATDEPGSVCESDFAGAGQGDEEFEVYSFYGGSYDLVPNFTDLCAHLGEGQAAAGWVGIAEPGYDGGEPTSLEYIYFNNEGEQHLALVDFD